MKETTFRIDHTLWEHRLQIMHPTLFNPAFQLDKVDIHSWFRGIFLVFSLCKQSFQYLIDVILQPSFYLLLFICVSDQVQNPLLISFWSLLPEFGPSSTSLQACIEFKISFSVWILILSREQSRADSLLQVIDAVSCQIKDKGHNTPYPWSED
jgi:hypothetical protein